MHVAQVLAFLVLIFPYFGLNEKHGRLKQLDVILHLWSALGLGV